MRSESEVVLGDWRQRDSFEAARILASHLAGYAHQSGCHRSRPVRGGVPVGFEIAKTLALRFDVFVVRKVRSGRSVPRDHPDRKGENSRIGDRRHELRRESCEA